jgi:O-antigen/teichoic acid export membrane protein
VNHQEPSSVAASAASANQATKKSLRGSSLMLVGRVITMVTNFAVQVLTVRYLSKGDYGAFAYVMSLISLGSSFAVFGMEKTVTRFLPIYQEKKEYSKLLGTLLIVFSTVLSLGFFLVVLVFGLRGWISESYITDEKVFGLLLILAVLTPIQALNSLLIGMLAVFSKPSSIFFRRHVLGPGLKLAVVLLLVLLRKDVYFLSIGHVVSSTLGILIYLGILIRDLQSNELWKHIHIRNISLPLKEVFTFSTPMLTTNIVYMLRSQLVIIILQHFRGTLDVASYRAVQPVADLNTTVIQSFTLLFMPAMARLFARNDQEGMDDLYWQNTVWIALISFPMFLVTFALAQPLTVLLFGERYAQSGLIMALLAFGYYFNAALGFNSDTLRIHGRVRYTVVVDFVSMLASLGLSLALIPRFGALGAAIGTCGTLVLYNILNHVGLKRVTNISLFNRHYIKVYASILLGTLALVVLQNVFSLPIYMGILLASAISLIVLLLNRNVLNIERNFPELLRIQFVRFLFEPRRSKKQLAE